MRDILWLQAYMLLKLKYLTLLSYRSNACEGWIARLSSSKYFPTITVRSWWLKMTALSTSTHNMEHTTKQGFLIILETFNTILLMLISAYQPQLTKSIDSPLKRASSSLPFTLIPISTPCTLINNLMYLSVEETNFRFGILGKERELVNYKQLTLFLT